MVSIVRARNKHDTEGSLECGGYCLLRKLLVMVDCKESLYNFGGMEVDGPLSRRERGVDGNCFLVFFVRWRQCQQADGGLFLVFLSRWDMSRSADAVERGVGSTLFLVRCHSREHDAGRSECGRCQCDVVVASGRS